MMALPRLTTAVADVPAGAWAIAVSGGADSVALLMLLRTARPDLAPHIVHLDHETRAGGSAADAAFVAELAARLAIPCTIARRGEVERSMTKPPKNRSARFRAARMHLFKNVIEQHRLAGVILAHHADDQAETILHRLLRGSGPTALAGMSSRATVCGVRLHRPLLSVARAELRAYLESINQPWRDDTSNTSPAYLRNRLRPILAANAALQQSLLNLGHACALWQRWLDASVAATTEQLVTAELAALPPPIARRAAAAWLKAHGCPVDEISHRVCDRLIQMAGDTASPARQHFPGAVLVRRRRGVMFVDRSERS
jgi:tRNA(Ile)-lysidine synthase